MVKHPFTGVDYIEYYKQLIENEGCEAEVILANSPNAILPYTKNVLACDIHTRQRTKKILLAAGAEKVCCLDEILNASVNAVSYTHLVFQISGSGTGKDYVQRHG